MVWNTIIILVIFPVIIHTHNMDTDKVENIIPRCFWIVMLI